MDSKIRYSGINDVINSLNTISNSNEEIGNLFKKTIEGFENNASLSSKVITPNMMKMIENITKINSEIKENSNAYCEFLSEGVNEKYHSTDEEMKNLWLNN